MVMQEVVKEAHKHNILTVADLWGMNMDKMVMRVTGLDGWAHTGAFMDVYDEDMKWMKENEPENYEQLDTILLPHDYINFWLTGEKKTECGDASGTAYFDVEKRRWSTRVLDAIDPSRKLSDCLPELVSSHEPCGYVRKEIVEAFGFSKDTLVSSGGGDNMMAAIGTGNVKPGVVTASLGTSGTIYAYSDAPVIDPQGVVASSTTFSRRALISSRLDKDSSRSIEPSTVRILVTVRLRTACSRR